MVISVRDLILLFKLGFEGVFFSVTLLANITEHLLVEIIIKAILENIGIKRG